MEIGKKYKIIIVLVLLLLIGVENSYSTSIRRLSWTEMIEANRFSAYHLGTFSESVTDSTAIFDIIESSKNGLRRLNINHKNFYSLEKNVFYVFMSSDSTDFVFGWNTKDKNEAYEMFFKTKEIVNIGRLTNIDIKMKEYKKWLFSLCESKCQPLKQEGFIEWQYGRYGIVQQYAQVYNLFDQDGSVSQEGWNKVITEADNRRFFNLLLNINYPSQQEWELFNSFRMDYTSEVKSYIYNYFKRYSENFDKNFDDIQSRKIQYGLAFVILNHVETNAKIIEILSEYEKDRDKDYPSQERRVLELYINPIIEQVDKMLK